MPTNKDQLIDLCLASLEEKRLTDKLHTRRLKDELLEVESQDLYDYFLEHHAKKNQWKQNENNLLLAYLLGLCDQFDINQPPASTLGDYPDIDVDYLEPVREHLKTVWAPATFGTDYVSNIGTCTTYNIKAALIDMARVFDQSREEVLNVTKQLGMKDDEGDLLTWDKAMELYPAFTTYVEKYPELAEAARKLCGHNRQVGKHAGGFIISSTPISSFAPLIVDKETESIMTAWSEGLASQDLQTVGLVKYDLLSLSMLSQITDCIKLIMDRHGIKKVCAVEGGPNWSDTSYLNDPLCMKTANEGDLRFIFQLDSPGMRKLVKMGGVDRFEDLMAYSSIWRPGPLGLGMHEAYCRRKKGKEKYEMHPVLEPILGSTYNIIIYQEQVMKILNKVGLIPMRNCYEVMKAISKKNIEKFAKYKEQFIENGQKVLGYTKEEVIDLFAHIQEFSGYGFKLCHACEYTYISCRQLWLKCYYPLEFFTSHMNHIGGIDPDIKLRDCKREAEAHGVKINRIDINKSHVDFSIVDDQVYFGLSHIKHMGREVAQKIIDARKDGDFKDFPDFIKRCGTGAKVVQSLISLGAFGDDDHVKMFNYVEWYKLMLGRNQSKKKRRIDSLKKYVVDFKDCTGETLEDVKVEDIERVLPTITDKDKVKKLNRMKGMINRGIKTNAEILNPALPSLSDFVPKEKKIDSDVLKCLTNKEHAELHYYGFFWDHPLQTCKNSEGFTFERYRSKKYEEKEAGPVEVLVEQIYEQSSKKGTTYHVLKGMDANWETAYVQVWENDYIRFAGILVAGNLVRLRVTPPNPKFAGNRYTFESFPPWMPQLLPPKDKDFRAVPLI